MAKTAKKVGKVHQPFGYSLPSNHSQVGPSTAPEVTSPFQLETFELVRRSFALNHWEINCVDIPVLCSSRASFSGYHILSLKTHHEINNSDGKWLPSWCFSIGFSCLFKTLLIDINFLITISAVYLMGISQGNIYNRFFFMSAYS